MQRQENHCKFEINQEYVGGSLISNPGFLSSQTYPQPPDFLGDLNLFGFPQDFAICEVAVCGLSLGPPPIFAKMCQCLCSLWSLLALAGLVGATELTTASPLCISQHSIIPRGSLSLKVLAELPIIVVLMYQVRVPLNHFYFLM